MPAKKRVPKYCLQKSSGLAYVKIDGRRHYLGKHGSEDSKARYRELVNEWETRIDPEAPVDLTIGELALLYVEHAKRYYVKDGRQTSEVQCITAAVRFLMPWRTLHVSRFNPRMLKAARDEMIRAGLVRTSINSQVGRIRRMLRWGVAETFVSPTTLVAIEALPPLKEGRCAAKESEPVRPVALEDVEAVLPHLTEPMRAVVEVLLLTGARTGEILPMRTGEIDRSCDPWEYTPRTHKTAHKGKTRVILLGPKAQGIILPFLRADPDAFVFRPTSASDRSYHKQAVRKAVWRAVESENAKREAEGERPIADWHPHQLRHTAATRFRREHGVEIAKSVLGHAKVEMTELYAERDLTAARAVIAKIG